MQVNSNRTRPHILLAACGSISAVKFKSLCHGFSEWAEVRAVFTRAALFFIDRASLPKNVVVYIDDDDWTNWGKIGDNVLHIQLCNWADIMVIAPLSANTLGKIAGGLCDNLLTCIVRAWDYSKPLFVAPAMSAIMWENSFTERHLVSVDDLGITLIRPKFSTGEHCNGAMAEPSLISSTVRLFLETRLMKKEPPKPVTCISTIILGNSNLRFLVRRFMPTTAGLKAKACFGYAPWILVNVIYIFSLVILPGIILSWMFGTTYCTRIKRALLLILSRFHCLVVI